MAPKYEPPVPDPPNLRFSCRICCDGKLCTRKQFQEHIRRSGDGFLSFEHFNLYRKLRRKIEKPRCFCGHPVSFNQGFRREDDIWWELVCENCGYMYDED